MADAPRTRRRAAAVAAAVAIAAPAEGLRQVWYYDPPGIPTVCFGHTGTVDKDRTYSLDECRMLLDADMTAAVDRVEACQPGLPPQVLAAFADAVYNIGPRIACDAAASTAARLLRARQYEAACRELPRWNKARVAGVLVSLPGLTSRRAVEMRACLAGAGETS